MGKRGPQSKHPSGIGYITPKGYHRFGLWDSATKSARQVLMHDYVWEQANGPIPAGYQVHHVNGDKQDNRLDNLRLVDTVTHKRLHSGCELRDGIWWKPCSLCGDLKPVDAEHWYLSAEGWPLYGRCRPCHIGRVVADKRARRHKVPVLPEGQ